MVKFLKIENVNPYKKNDYVRYVGTNKVGKVISINEDFVTVEYLDNTVAYEYKWLQPADIDDVMEYRKQTNGM
jgi:hypothetical protein